MPNRSFIVWVIFRQCTAGETLVRAFTYKRKALKIADALNKSILLDPRHHLPCSHAVKPIPLVTHDGANVLLEELVKKGRSTL